jgi:hypothetical protein
MTARRFSTNNLRVLDQFDGRFRKKPTIQGVTIPMEKTMVNK